jgi:hypothetical protein
MTLPAERELAPDAPDDSSDEGSVRPRYRRRAFRIAIGAVVVLLLAELVVRGVGGRLPQPLVFYDPVPQVKDAQLSRLSRSGGADVVVAGPSSALFGVDPTVLERRLGGGSRVTVYNAGITAGVPAMTADWLERFVLNRVHPRTVVWVLSTVDLNDGVRLPAVDTYFTSLEGRNDVWARLDRAASRHSALFRYRRELRSPKILAEAATRAQGPVELWATRLTSGGLATYEGEPLNEVARQQLLSEVANFHMGGADTDLVVREIERMNARGIHVVLAEAPVPERAVVLHPHGAADFTALTALLDRIAARTHSRVVPLPAELRADALYQDYTHLNHAGTARYSDFLANALR